MTPVRHQNKRFVSALYKMIANIVLLGLGIAPLHVYSEIKFRDVSKTAGINQSIPTAASAWGDVNADGWPDIWVSNHHGLPPSLYVNQKNGKFIDLHSALILEDLRADFHGVAWADYDNDGDQDMIAVTGGAAGRGASPNYFFVNEGGQLINKAKQLGIDYPLGRGRTPLWLDVNQDGKLDILLMNRMRKEAPSALFVQTDNGFVDKTKKFRFSRAPRSSNGGIFSDIKQLLGVSKQGKSGEIKVNNAFAQLASLSDQKQMELIAYTQPSRFYSIKSKGLKAVTDKILLPKIAAVEDVAIGDFNGDGEMDMFLVRARSGSRDISMVNARSIKGKMGGPTTDMASVKFRTDGDVTFEIHRPWYDPSDRRSQIYPKLYIGSEERELKSEIFTIPVDSAAARERAPSLKKAGGGISIEFNPVTREWTLANLGQLIGFIITSTKNIESFNAKGFKPKTGSEHDVLLIRKGNRFVAKKLRFTDQATSCSSVTAGDFDNDMDLDLYLVCAGPVENLTNILYENDGKANFIKVKDAGGAEGSIKGRGNQVAMADYNLDGFLDLFVTNGAGPPPFSHGGPHQLFQNMRNNNHWLEIDLRGSESNRDGIGAKLVLSVNGKTQVRHVDGGMHSFSQNHMRVHFGLGPHEKADSLSIYWPAGQVQHLVDDIPANQILVVDEKI